MLVSVTLTAAKDSMYGARLHKTSRWDAVAWDPRRDLLDRDRDILLWDETWDASVQELLRILFETRPRRDVSTSRDRLDRDHIPGHNQNLD